MLKRAPSVYVPVEPEDNGVTLPAILSLVVHGSILAFIILSHRVPTIDTPPPIETSIVTPEELAAMQAEISNNRVNAASMGDATHFDNTSDDSELSSTITTDQQEPESDSIATKVLRRTVSVFTKSDEPADTITESEDMPEDNGYDAEYAERQDLEKANAAFQRQVDAEIAEKGRVHKEYLANRDQKEKSSAPPLIEKPKSGNKKPSASNNSSANAQNENFDWSKEGKPASGNGGNSKSASGSNNANISSELVGLIKPYWNPPTNRIGESVSASIEVDAGGMIISVSVNTSDQALRESLETAIENASPLTPLIGTDIRKIKLNFRVE